MLDLIIGIIVITVIIIIAFERYHTTPYLIYEDFINSNTNFDQLTLKIKIILVDYVKTLCRSFETILQDILKHLRREINIFSLLEHLKHPTKDSPEKIFLGGKILYLNKEKLQYYIKTKELYILEYIQSEKEYRKLIFDAMLEEIDPFILQGMIEGEIKYLIYSLQPQLLDPFLEELNKRNINNLDLISKHCEDLIYFCRNFKYE